MNPAAPLHRLALGAIGAFALFLLECSAAVGAQNQTSAQHGDSRPVQTFRISGTVVSATTGVPLSNALVSIVESRNPRNGSSVVTSEDGRFEFSEVGAGKYSLRGAKRGFLSSAYDQHEQFSTAIVTGSEFSTENLVLRLTPMAVITGHVYDESGNPVHDAHLALYLEDHSAGMNRIARFQAATSDDRGYYDFAPLGPGAYYISATAKPWYAVHPAITSGGVLTASQPSRSFDVVYPTTYYNGATESDSATPIEVKGGDRLQIDILLNPVPALHIVVRRPQEGAEQWIPALQKRIFGTSEFLQPDGWRPISPGVYEMTGIPPGRYTVTTTNSNSGQTEQSKDVDLMRDGQDLAESRGEPLGSLTLTLKMQNGESLPKPYNVGLQDSGKRTVAVKVGDPSGRLIFDGLAPGAYAVLVASPTEAYAVMRTSSKAGDSAGHGFTVPPGATLDLTAFMTAGNVSIEGVVQKSGKPLAGVMVALVPKEPEAHVEFFRRDQSDLDGTFRLQGVIPGSYTIVAVQDAWGFEWLQPGVLARYVQHGQSVNVGEAMRGTVHLPTPIEVQPH